MKALYLISRTLIITAIILTSTTISKAQESLKLNNNSLIALMNKTLDDLNPKLHINQVGPKWRKAKGSYSLYKKGDIWMEIGGKRFQLPDFPVFTRTRRSHYIQDLNSTDWEFLPAYNGFKLRIYFETDMNEIKGWCRTCVGGGSDDRAADANFLPTDGKQPYLEATFQFGENGSLSPSITAVKVAMKVNANGILDWFNNTLTQKMQEAMEQTVKNNFNQHASSFLPILAQHLGRMQNKHYNYIANWKFEDNNSSRLYLIKR